MQSSFKKTVFILISSFALNGSVSIAASTASPGVDRRLAHAKELLGSTYKRSVVRKSESVENIDDYIVKWTKASLKGKYKKQARALAKTIIAEAQKHEFDPVFLMAVIQNESSFRPTQRGSAGEIGLMQLLPATARWIADHEGMRIKNIKQALLSPVMNVKLGAAYLSYLREKFDSHGRLYLSAYNMGPKNVNRALSHQVWPKDYSLRVMEKYISYYRKLKNDLPRS